MDLATTLAGALGAALVLGYVAHRLRLSPIVGYLVAGVCVGPFTPGFVAHTELAREVADVGVVLLMFGVGLQFEPGELLHVRRIVVPGALGQIVVTSAVGAGVATLTGLPISAAVLFGLSIAVSSTVVAVRTLGDNDALHAAVGRTALGWLVVEDLFTVVLLVVAPSIVGGEHDPLRLGLSVGRALLQLGVLTAITLVVGRRLVPAVLARVARTRSRELFTLTVLVVALGLAIGASRLVGASLALGAFLAGIVVGRSTFAARAAADALPMRDAFAVVFFVSIGMLLDPRAVAASLPLAGGVLAIVLFGKPIVVLVLTRLIRTPPRTALLVAASLAQIGEFSFLVTGLGRDLGALPPAATQVVVLAAIVSTVTSPILFRFASRWVPRAEPAPAEDVAGPRAIVVGYGPVGRTLVGVLEAHGVATTVIELNHETAEALGPRAVHGDASQAAVLEAAGIAGCDTLVFAASGAPNAVASAAKRVKPSIRVIARAAYVHEVARARRAGADVVVVSEIEVALAMGENLLATLGASPEQIDRARDELRAALTAAPASSRDHASP